jgi:hypothetical protein
MRAGGGARVDGVGVLVSWTVCKGREEEGDEETVERRPGDCFDGDSDGLESNDDDDEMGTTLLNKSRTVGIIEHAQRLRRGMRAQWNLSHFNSSSFSSLGGSGFHTSPGAMNGGGIGEYRSLNVPGAMAR